MLYPTTLRAMSSRLHLSSLKGGTYLKVLRIEIDSKPSISFPLLRSLLLKHVTAIATGLSHSQQEMSIPMHTSQS